MKDTLTLDKLIVEFDVGLRTLFAKPHSLRAHPDADIAEATLDATENLAVTVYGDGRIGLREAGRLLY